MALSPMGWTDLYDLGVRASDAGDVATARLANDVLLAREDLPEGFRDLVRRRQVIGAQRLGDLAPSFAVRPIGFEVPAGWSLFNPSIAAADDGYLMIVRSSNYSVDRGRYTFEDGSGIIRTRNYLLSISDDFTIRRLDEIEDRTDQSSVSVFPVTGFEDCRLFRYGDAWYATATVRDRNPQGICQIAMVSLRGTAFADLRLLNEPGSGRHEKNWMPVLTADGLSFIYSSFPTVVLRYDDSGTVEEVARRSGPLIAESFRGGSQGIAVEGGYLGVVHESVELEDQGRIYAHRFVFFDRDFVLRRVSPPFSFLDRGIEFCAGLASRGEALVASFGAGDRQAYLATMRLDEILAMLRPAEGDTGGLPLFAGKHTEPCGITPFPRDRPEIVSMTLTGNSADLIGDAIRSVVDWVDACLVIDTGVTDDTLAIARSVAGAKYVERRFPWCDDFALARTFALHAARDLGARWAVTLDTDERIDRRGLDIVAALGAVSEDVLRVEHDGGTYDKERFFRLPTPARFVGPTHEYVDVPPDRVGRLAEVRFAEVAKSPEALRQKFERDVAVLTRHVERYPRDARWWYYLGDALHGLGRDREAIDAFVRCAALPGWDEQAAWACYRAAECWLVLGNPEEAVSACAAGLAHHPGIAELSWLAAYACWHAGRLAHAVSWSHLSIAQGCFRGRGHEVPRSGFRNPSALYEGPYDVLRFALRALGDEAGADEAQQLFEAAAAARAGA